MINDLLDYSSKMVMDSIELNLTAEGNPALYHYYEDDKIWQLFEEVVNDEGFMKIVIYNNDYLKIAPVHTFCAYYLDGGFELTSFEKNSVGRLFKYVFKTLGYTQDIRVSRSNAHIQHGKVFVKENNTIDEENQ